jgi:RNA 3'-terminal phosphate cyclase-like protein
MSALTFKGSCFFRFHVTAALLSGRTITIDAIRADSETPGINDDEASYLRLVDKLTNGTQIQINQSGTKLRFKPGVLIGGEDIEHSCGATRGIGWFIEGVLPLLLFCKLPTELRLTGVTNDCSSCSVDLVRTVMMPFIQVGVHYGLRVKGLPCSFCLVMPCMQHFGVDDGLELRVVRRGAPPSGGGEVVLRSPSVKALKSVTLDAIDRIRRVRGLAYCLRVSPTIAARMVDAARGVLNAALPDVFIYTDVAEKAPATQSPGFALNLVAEGINGCKLCAEVVGEAGQLPEEVGARCAALLLQQVQHTGFVDSCCQPLAFLLMVLTPEDVSRVLVGPLTAPAVQMLRLLRDFFGVTFKICPDVESAAVTLSCIGIGYSNIARATT